MGTQRGSVATEESGKDFIVTRTIIELVNDAELLKIHKDISEALTEVERQIAEIPKTVTERTKVLQAQKVMLDARKEEFDKYAEKIKDKEVKETP